MASYKSYKPARINEANVMMILENVQKSHS